MSFDGMTEAEKHSALRCTVFLQQIQEKRDEVKLLRREWEQKSQAAKQAKTLYEEARDECDAMIDGGIPRPDPQAKFAFDTNLTELALPGEVQDLLLDAGIENLATLGEIIRGNSEDYESLDQVDGVSEEAADQITGLYREWYAKAEADLEAEGEDGVAVDDDVIDEEMIAKGPNENAADAFDDADFDQKYVVVTVPEGYDHLEVGQEVEGKKMDMGVMLKSGDFLNEGEYKAVS